MQPDAASRTALSAARHRAAHQVLERGLIFSDPFAARILGEEAAAIADEAVKDPHQTSMRLFIAARSRLAEDALAEAVSQGLRQAVILGAGLDTFALRNRDAELRVFEVDHPATQAWKRRRLAEAGLSTPAGVAFVPVDFVTQSLLQALTSAGFDRNRPAFFAWLGVVPYLTPSAALETLALLGALPGGAEIVFDYSDPPESMTADQRQAHLARAARVAAIGEPWLCYFRSDDLASALAARGFSRLDDLGPSRLAARFFGGAEDAPARPGGHVIWASTAWRARGARPILTRA